MLEKRWVVFVGRPEEVPRLATTKWTERTKARILVCESLLRRLPAETTVWRAVALHLQSLAQNDDAKKTRSETDGDF